MNGNHFTTGFSGRQRRPDYHRRLLFTMLMVLSSYHGAMADIDFTVRPCDPVLPGTRCFELIPILRDGQVLMPVSPIPDPFPPLTNLSPGTPPFIEIFDIPAMNVGQVEPPPPFEAIIRSYSDPSPYPNIVDLPDQPNLLLAFGGANAIFGPTMFDPFDLHLPPEINSLQYFAYAFDTQNVPAINMGTITVPEPTGLCWCLGGAVGLGVTSSLRQRVRAIGARRARSG